MDLIDRFSFNGSAYFLQIITNRYTSPFWLVLTNSWPDALQKAEKSSSEFGSVAMTSSFSPEASVFKIFFVFRIGKGQFNPAASRYMSVIFKITH